MKILRSIFFAWILNAVFTCMTLPAHAQTQDAVSIQVFYDALSPYGQWIYDNTYKYVWVPSAQNGFRPYFTNGYWVMTEFGSTWVSGYPWGWAPFHYGRWVHDALYKWMWVPDLQWGPAWVVWRANGDNYGWCPITPGISLEGSMGSTFYAPDDWWVFIPHNKLLSHDLSHIVKSATENHNLVKQTAPLNKTAVSNNQRYATGPVAVEYGRTVKETVTVYSVKAASAPGKMVVGKNELTIYRPAVTTSTPGNTPQPKKYTQATHSIGKPAPIGSTKSVAAPKPKTKKAPAKK